MIPLLCIAGPTASGKTALSIALAKRHGCEIVSADSMQIYKKLDIGTAKPGFSEMEGVVHHMLDVAEPSELFSVADYCRMTHSIIKDITSRGKKVILAGGTGLYINSIVNNTDFSKGDSDDAFREMLWKEAESCGAEVLHKRLLGVDPESAARIHQNDIRRVIRALEVYEVTGKPMSEYRREAAAGDKIYNAVKIGLTMDRAKLYNRINKRVDIMLEAGLLDEVKSVCSEDFKASTAAQAIGYKELIAFLEGRMTYDEAVEQIKQGSRNYAKRQLSFFRADKTINWIDITDMHLSDIINEAEKKIGGIFNDN